ncbi:protein SSUH2 homolog isoform X2 [Argiope bruennichi]|uniref:protein SSUH2 homolog isoform X2 n=1 Tax=Argiope bruennichi TaxID=94029 RepID=UPI002494BD75|nr:protein SSUH2 homolog isoform X2 [Argiope bruennichi]
MEEISLPSYEEIIPGFTEMEKMKPPNYEEAIAAEPSPYSPGINIPYIDDPEPSPHSPGINIAYIDDPVFQPTPTAPTMDMIESVETPILIPAPLSDPDLRTALYHYRNKLRCGGSKFIKDMILTDIQNDCAFHCKLETFIEKRECTPRVTGYYGQNIDGPENGITPDKWNVRVGRPLLFDDDQEIKTEVPHTAYVRECPTCEGEKKIDCTPCWANGKVICKGCQGRGAENLMCRICKGSGDEDCLKCSGSGMIDCSHCDGYGKLKYCMQLTATWKTQMDELVSNRYNLPNELVLKASGKEIFVRQAQQIEPLNTAHPALNEASAVLIKKHTSSLRNKAVVAQRLSLRAIPLTRATYIWKKKKGEFYVYGFEKNVHFEDYPEQFSMCAVS